MIHEDWTLLQIISTEGVFYFLSSDKTFSKICGRWIRFPCGFTITYCSAYVSGRGEYSWVFHFIALLETFCGIIVFGKFSCGPYVIVVLNCDTVVFLNMRNFLWLARRFLAWLCQFLNFSLRCYGVPYTASRSLIFFCACVYFSNKTGFDSVILCPVAVLERFTKQYFHDNLLCAWTHQRK